MLHRLPDDLVDPVEIVDTYVARSTLRLRRMRTASAAVYKLGQKVRQNPERPSPVHITNIYLTEGEFVLLGQLEGAMVSKTRWRWHVGDRVLSVDQFSGHLAGLVLAEVELGPEESAPPPPLLARADVTEDDRFSGGRLANLGPAGARDLLQVVAAMSGEAQGGAPVEP